MMNHEEVKANTLQVLKRAGASDLHAAVYVMSFSLSQPIPEPVIEALMDIFGVPRKFIIFAALDCLFDFYFNKPMS